MHDAMYFTELAAAGVVGGLALVGDSLEGAIASALLSPLGAPVGAIAPALVGGAFFDAASSAALTFASAAFLALIGACVRVWDRAYGGQSTPTRGTASVSTQLAYHLSAPLNVRKAIAYACVVGAVAALGASTGPRAGSGLAARSVGLGIATSMTVPFVAAGISLWDAFAVQHDRLRRGGSSADAAKRGAYLSASRAACAISGTILSGAIIASLFGRRTHALTIAP